MGVRRKKRQAFAAATHSSDRSRRTRSRLEDTPPRALETSERERISAQTSEAMGDDDESPKAAEPACGDRTSSPSLGRNLPQAGTSAAPPSPPLAAAAASADRFKGAETEVSASGRPKRKLVAPTRFAASTHSIGPKRARRSRVPDVGGASRRTEEGSTRGSLLASLSSDSASADKAVFGETRLSAHKEGTPLQSSAGLPSPPPTGEASRQRQPDGEANQAKLARPSDAFSPETRDSSSGLHSPPPTGDSTRNRESWAAAGRFVRAPPPTSVPVAVASTVTNIIGDSLEPSPFRFSTASTASDVCRGAFVAPTRNGLRWTESPDPSRQLDHPALVLGRDSTYGPPHSNEGTDRPPQAHFPSFDGFSHDIHAFPTSDIYTRPPDDRHSTPLRFIHDPVSRSRMQDVRDPYLMTPPGSGGDPYSMGPSRVPLVPTEDDWSAAFARQLDAAILAVGAADVFHSGNDLDDEELVSSEVMTSQTSVAETGSRTIRANLHSDDMHSGASTAFYAPQLSNFSPVRLHHGERNAPLASHSSDSLDAFF